MTLVNELGKGRAFKRKMVKGIKLWILNLLYELKIIKVILDSKT